MSRPMPLKLEPCVESNLFSLHPNATIALFLCGGGESLAHNESVGLTRPSLFLFLGSQDSLFDY